MTIAIPTCNGARHLPDALRSILAQEGIAFNLLVSDDRSEDETLEVVRAEAGDRARIVVNSERLGLAGNWNQCVTLSRTPLVAIFHQDDVMRPGHLAAHTSKFATDDRLGMVASAAEVVDAKGRDVPESIVGRGGLGPADRSFAPGELIREMASGNPLRCSAVTIRSAAHADVGGFDASYRYVVDWDFWLRVAQRWGTAWLARPTVAIRWHPASETHRFKTGTTDLDETARLLDGIFRSAALPVGEAKALHRIADRRLSRAFLNRAYEAIRGGDSALARHCVRRSIALWPGIIGTILADPKLTIQMMAIAVGARSSKRP